MDQRRFLAAVGAVLGFLAALPSAQAFSPAPSPRSQEAVESTSGPRSSDDDLGLGRLVQDPGLPAGISLEDTDLEKPARAALRDQNLPGLLGEPWLPEELAQDSDRNRSSRPLIDFMHPDIIPSGGLVQFSHRFRSGVEWCAGVFAQLPMPRLVTQKYAIFGGGLVSELQRSLDPARPHESGLFEMGTLGGEYDFTREKGGILAARLGAAYLGFNGTAGTRSGPAGVVGIELGLYREKEPGEQGIGVVYAPFFVFNGRDYLLFHTFGILIHF